METKKLSTRFGKDKRIFTLLIEKNKKPYSQHLYNLPEELGKLNEIEKKIMYVKILTERSVNQLQKNYNKKYIYLTDYETIISNTKKELIKISKFLNTSLSKKLLNLLRKKNVQKLLIIN